MNFETDLLAKTAVELRKLGAAMGIPGAAKGRKADLVVAIAAKMDQERIDREAAKKAEAAKAEAPAKKNRCESCGVRPKMGAAERLRRGVANDLPYCGVCEEQAGWENTHSDYDHEGVRAGTIEFGQTTHRTREEFAAWLADEKSATENCWVCRDCPDEEYKARRGAGTSRAGMRMTVRRGDAAVTKAKVVIDAATARNAKILYAGSPERSGEYVVKLSIEGREIELHWDLAGRYLYGPSVAAVAGKLRKVRNVSEALKLIG